MRITRPIARHPYPDEPLTDIFPGVRPGSFNLEQTLVVELDGRVVGGMIFWDAGHDAVRASNFNVIEPYRAKGVGVALLDALQAYCRKHGRKVIVGETHSVDMAYWAKKKGASVSAPLHLLWWPVMEETK